MLTESAKAQSRRRRSQTRTCPATHTKPPMHWFPTIFVVENGDEIFANKPDMKETKYYYAWCMLKS